MVVMSFAHLLGDQLTKITLLPPSETIVSNVNFSLSFFGTATGSVSSLETRVFFFDFPAILQEVVKRKLLHRNYIDKVRSGNVPNENDVSSALYCKETKQPER